MKKDIHPKYYTDAKVICACGHTITTGATQPEIHVEICSNCHPFYTGKQQIIDDRGRVGRFQRMVQKKSELAAKKKKAKKAS